MLWNEDQQVFDKFHITSHGWFFMMQIQMKWLGWEKIATEKKINIEIQDLNKKIDFFI